MAKKIFLRDENNVKVLPITRGELILDSSGNPAFHSNEFLATDSQPGLMSPADKQKLETVAGNTVDTELSNTSTNPVQNKVLTQIINSIREKYLKSAVVSGNKVTITDQSNNTVEFVNSTYQIVTNAVDGLVPKYDAVDGTIDTQTTDWVLTNHNGTLGWYKLPAAAFSSSSVQLFVGAKSTSNNNNSNSATTNSNTYLKLFDNSTLKNQYNIKGTGLTTVISDASGTITINTPTSHNQASSDINSLTGYTKATAVAAIATSDSLNSALGKLELKADTTYELVKGAYDGDGTIENLAEILKVLEGIKDTETIQAIIGKYLPLTGGELTGALSIKCGADRKLILDSTDGEKWSLISFREKGEEYGYLGVTGNSILSWNGAVVLNSENYNSYAPKLDGTGATGTWNIDISGTAANASALNSIPSDGFIRHISYINPTTPTADDFFKTLKAARATGLSGVWSNVWENIVSNTTLGWGFGLIYTQNSYGGSNGVNMGGIYIPQSGGSLYLLSSSGGSSSVAVSVSADRIITEKIINNYLPTVTNYYWANIPISATSNSATSPTFATATAKAFYATQNGQSLYWGPANEYWLGSNTTTDAYLWLSNNTAALRFGTSNTERMRITKDGAVGIGVSNPGYQLHVNGLICSNTGFVKTGSSNDYILLGGGNHKAISDFMLKSDELTNNLTTITKTLTVTKDWMDTGIKYTDLTTGTYAVQVTSYATNNLIWDGYWSGIMTWYGDGTNSSESDEILLHRGAHAYNGNTIYLRTINTVSSDGRHMRLQIAANKNFSSATYTFKFKKLI